MERGEVEEEEEEKEERKSGSSYTSLVSGCSSRSSVCLAPPTWTRLVPLRTQYETSRFLQAISLKFWKVVDIEDPGMLEDLMAAGVVTADDAESLAGIHLPTRKDKTRRLWSILNNIHHRRFSKKVLPILCKYYWHIIPENFWLPGNASPIPETRSSPREDGSESSGGSPYCLRCAIQSRIRPTDVGDILAAAGLITPKIHRDIVSRYRNCSTDWSKLFRAFKKLAGHDSSSHVTKMRRLIARHSLRVPGHLPRLLVEGFPCTCPSRRKPRYCIAACLRVPSSSESSLASVLTLPVSDSCRSPSSLSLPSAPSTADDSSHSHRVSADSDTSLRQVVCSGGQNYYSHPGVEGWSSDSHRWSDVSETSLKQFASINAQNPPFQMSIPEKRTDTNDENSQKMRAKRLEPIISHERKLPSASSLLTEDETERKVFTDATDHTDAEESLEVVVQNFYMTCHQIENEWRVSSATAGKDDMDLYVAQESTKKKTEQRSIPKCAPSETDEDDGESESQPLFTSFPHIETRPKRIPSRADHELDWYLSEEETLKKIPFAVRVLVKITEIVLMFYPIILVYVAVQMDSLYLVVAGFVLYYAQAPLVVMAPDKLRDELIRRYGPVVSISRTDDWEAVGLSPTKNSGIFGL